MNLKRQLMLVSLLTLVLPWAGCQFIRQTESALRDVQQEMLAGTARALASELSQYVDDFPRQEADVEPSDQLYLQSLDRAPTLDGYFDDWPLDSAALNSVRGPDGNIQYAVGTFGTNLYLYIAAPDRAIVYARTTAMALNNGPLHADRITLISQSPPYRNDGFIFAAEAPGKIATLRNHPYEPEEEPAIDAIWQDTARGYQVEARIPLNLLGTHLGIAVSNTEAAEQPAVRVRNYARDNPPRSVFLSAVLTDVLDDWTRAQSGMRVVLTDAIGWRIASSGQLSASPSSTSTANQWSERIYGLIVEPGTEASLAEPDPQGRERQPYIAAALAGDEQRSWFRSKNSGLAVVATATPIINGDRIIGSVVLQQNTDAILSLTNTGLARLINLTLVATLLVAASLLGYATWLSRRIGRLSSAATTALSEDNLRVDLPSALADDEIGELSRNFSDVLHQLGDYNDYLRSLASKLSHELRTPLTIVTSSLENLEHEALSETAAGYTTRARDGADRLRTILVAMSEASRVEELMQNVEFEAFLLDDVVIAACNAYRDIVKDRHILCTASVEDAQLLGSPELIVQMLDKLIENAADFSSGGDTIEVSIRRVNSGYQLSVHNPGPPLPKNMQSQLFDSLVSVRESGDSRHLGLGLFVARLIAEGHGGSIEAKDVPGGVTFSVELPDQGSR